MEQATPSTTEEATQGDGKSIDDTILQFVGFLDKNAIPTLNGNEDTKDLAGILHANRQALVTVVGMNQKIEAKRGNSGEKLAV